MSNPLPMEKGKIYRARKGGMRVWDEHDPGPGRLKMHLEFAQPHVLPRNALVMVTDYRPKYHVVQIVFEESVGWVPISNIERQWPKYFRQVKG